MTHTFLRACGATSLAIGLALAAVEQREALHRERADGDTGRTYVPQGGLRAKTDCTGSARANSAGSCGP